MQTKKIQQVKFYGLSWVIELHFSNSAEAKEFIEREGFNKKIKDSQTSAVIRIED